VLGSELRTWLQVDKFVRINNTAQAAPTLRKILAEHASDNTNRRARLVAKLTELLRQQISTQSAKNSPSRAAPQPHS
jgi:hypothetical protein